MQQPKLLMFLNLAWLECSLSTLFSDICNVRSSLVVTDYVSHTCNYFLTHFLALKLERISLVILSPRPVLVSSSPRYYIFRSLCLCLLIFWGILFHSIEINGHEYTSHCEGTRFESWIGHWLS
jgi:hypothetical protein